MKKPYLFSLVLTASLLLVSCGGSGSGGSVTGGETYSSAEKTFVYNLFTTEYLWFDEVDTTVDYNAFTTPQGLIDGLKVEQDRWSFTLTSAEYEDMVNQTTAGFGFGYWEDFMVYLVRIDSPAWNLLQRGDKILEVNGEVASNENIAAASQNLNVASTFTVLRDGQSTSFSMTPRAYSFKVTQGKILSNDVGYLRYDSFTSTSVGEFEAEFTKFKAAGIKELVVDLRYNGGGSVDVASTLLDNINDQHEGQLQVYLDWNVNYKVNNSNYYFGEVESNDLRMHRVVFLVTRDSASASELVISALKPYLGESNVITIGDYTHGKPVGMGGRTYGANYYFLINFYVRNSFNETTSMSGIAPTCTAEDDLTHLRGDEDETMLASALYYIQSGNCL